MADFMIVDPIHSRSSLTIRNPRLPLSGHNGEFQRQWPSVPNLPTILWTESSANTLGIETTPLDMFTQRVRTCKPHPSFGNYQSLWSVDALQEFVYKARLIQPSMGRKSWLTIVVRDPLWERISGLVPRLIIFGNDFFDATIGFNNYLGKSEPPFDRDDFGGNPPSEGRSIFRVCTNGRDKKTLFLCLSDEGLRQNSHRPRP